MSDVVSGNPDSLISHFDYDLVSGLGKALHGNFYNDLTVVV
jgi:hypothetical protein